MMDKIEHDRLKEIRETMMELLEEASTILRQSGDKNLYERSKAYWIGNIDTGLGGGAYVDTYAFTMEKAINEIKPPDPDDEEYYDE